MHPLRNAALLGGLALLGLPVANAAELIISEYVEGSGNNKALEFYNSGSQVLDLSAYRVEIYFNGASAAGRSIDLSGSLAPGKTFVLANGVADPALLALASQRVGAGSYTHLTLPADFRGCGLGVVVSITERGGRRIGG